MAFVGLIPLMKNKRLSTKCLEIHNGLLPDIFTGNIIIDRFCRQGRMKMENNIFMEMYTNGVAPDVITYSTFISAYCRALVLNQIFSYTIYGSTASAPAV
ncbi:unnamed protein product [Musa banksii]